MNDNVINLEQKKYEHARNIATRFAEDVIETLVELLPEKSLSDDDEKHRSDLIDLYNLCYLVAAKRQLQ